MFLTNNYKTINNLMIYSKGICNFKIIPKYYPYQNMLDDYKWICTIQKKRATNLLKTSEYTLMDHTIKPYGNAKERIDLRKNNEEKVEIYYYEGGKYF